MSHAELKSYQRRKYSEALLVGCCFALGALPPSAVIIMWATEKNSMRWLILTSVVAAFVAGTLVWRKVFGHGRKPTFWRGAGVGALVVILAHPLAWYLLFLLLYFSGEVGSFPERTLDPLRGLVASLTFSAVSLLMFGWATVSIGAAIGGGLGYVAGKEWEKSAGLYGLIHKAEKQEQHDNL
jgi:hypothetical protein